MPESAAAKTQKGERTREVILEAAMKLFREKGYEATTMRAVAKEAGVSVGNAYYYFKSKEHLTQGYYAQSHVDHLAASEPILEKETTLAKRLRGVLVAKIETAAPYHRFARVLFKTAGDPSSPLSPFSEESREVREEAILLMARTLEGAKVKVPKDLAIELPELLWLYEMGIIMYWIHDDSEGQARTLRLIDRTVDLVVKLIGIASFPLMKPVRTATLRLLKDLKS